MECDYLSVQRCVKFTLSLPSVWCFQHFQKFWNIADIRIVEEFLLAIVIKLKAKTCKGHDDVVTVMPKLKNKILKNKVWLLSREANNGVVSLTWYLRFENPFCWLGLLEIWCKVDLVSEILRPIFLIGMIGKWVLIYAI